MGRTPGPKRWQDKKQRWDRGAQTIVGESRPTIFAARNVASKVLTEQFEATGSDRVSVEVDEAQLRRAVVALRVASPNPSKRVPMS
jgi:hypothetical protein